MSEEMESTSNNGPHEPMARYFVMEAYKIPVYHRDEDILRTINDFRDKAFLMCWEMRMEEDQEL